MSNAEFQYPLALDRSTVLAGSHVTHPQPKRLFQSIGLEDDSSIEKHLAVVLRLKPVSGPCSSFQIAQNHTEIMFEIPNTDRLDSYRFNKIFDATTSQQDMFDECVKPKVLAFINGQNETIMAYGISGSGKTFTMLGDHANPGLIPRSLDYLFRTLPKLNAQPRVKILSSGRYVMLNAQEARDEVMYVRNLTNTSRARIDLDSIGNNYRTMKQRLSVMPSATLSGTSETNISVWVSFYQIYNEKIFDLLAETKPMQTHAPLKLGQDRDHVFVRNLTTCFVTSDDQAFKLLHIGKQNLNYAATKVNAHSSRSHCVFTVYLVETDKNLTHKRHSRVNFCDLAGSERAKHTENAGVRLKESSNINTSLHILGKCLRTIHDIQQTRNASASSDATQRNVTIPNKRVIPYRESKLTQVFKEGLSGYENVTMIVNMAPLVTKLDENLHVLAFSAIAKQISVIAPVRESRVLSQYTRNASLRSLLGSFRASIGDVNVTDDDLMLTALRDEVKAELEARFNEERAKLCAHHTTEIMKLIRSNHDKAEELYDQISKLKSLKVHNEREIARLNAQLAKWKANESSDVIVISDDDECEVKDYKLTVETMKEQLMAAERAKVVLESEIETINVQMQEKESMYEEQQAKMRQELQALTSDGLLLQLELNEMKQENTKLKLNNYQLEDRVKELEERLSAFDVSDSELLNDAASVIDSINNDAISNDGFDDLPLDHELGDATGNDEDRREVGENHGDVDENAHEHFEAARELDESDDQGLGESNNQEMDDHLDENRTGLIAKCVDDDFNWNDTSGSPNAIDYLANISSDENVSMESRGSRNATIIANADDAVLSDVVNSRMTFCDVKPLVEQTPMNKRSDAGGLMSVKTKTPWTVKVYNKNSVYDDDVNEASHVNCSTQIPSPIVWDVSSGSELFESES